MTARIGIPGPGVVRTLIVAWRLDDPAVPDDGRFWMKVGERDAGVLGRPPGTLIAKGRSLKRWRAGGDVVVAGNPVTGADEGFSLARWTEEDPDRTHVMLAFMHVGDAPRLLPPSTRQDEVGRLERDHAALALEYREADGGEHLAARIAATVGALRQADFPNYTPGWNLDRAVRPTEHQFILDWMTGY